MSSIAAAAWWSAGPCAPWATRRRRPVWSPGHRGQGLGSGLLDRLIGEARPVRLETESVTPEAHALFLLRGLRQTFAEDVYRRDAIASTGGSSPHNRSISAGATGRTSAGTSTLTSARNFSEVI
ncbi:GNAT family N-acetyltransferase [Nonomuraea aurantiaca]|uniref:GNAT family N-acetyltransferase n=1 Tax=Nonomuraea aurantiaca TaxID=2878562 RepID=UPI001CDA4C69|nr:GNAT family N-acetyltransferase [Nonomuraea aurantiaca]MCA2228285.1 GNAT family N-acetyltransferase [Nonomuraea aurantiaca]